MPSTYDTIVICDNPRCTRGDDGAPNSFTAAPATPTWDSQVTMPTGWFRIGDYYYNRDDQVGENTIHLNATIFCSISCQQDYNEHELAAEIADLGAEPGTWAA